MTVQAGRDHRTKVSLDRRNRRDAIVTTAQWQAERRALRIPRCRAQPMNQKRRWRSGLVGLLVAALLGAGAMTLDAQTASVTVADPVWTRWLQILVNLIKVVEMAVFTFSGYQFWAGRRER